jgi:hypothetical protein
MSPKAPEGAGADYSAVASLGRHLGVWTKSLARRTLPHGLSAGIVGCVSLGSQEVYRDPSSAAHAG